MWGRGLPARVLSRAYPGDRRRLIELSLRPAYGLEIYRRPTKGIPMRHTVLPSTTMLSRGIARDLEAREKERERERGIISARFPEYLPVIVTLRNEKENAAATREIMRIRLAGGV